jgi:glycerol-3-phosphate dehydrogenase
MAAESYLDLRDRAALLRTLERSIFDILIIGGGITGAGVARDAAMRGLSVALIEAQDFASGTSSRSSKMVHGGLRYLARGEISIVREAASERRVLNAIAPHLAQPAWFILPSRNRATTVKLKAALWTFDRLGAVAPADAHRFLSRREFGEREPIARTDKLHGAFSYREYLTDDARLTLANIRSAHAHGAIVANYFHASRVTGGTVSEVRCKSTLEGDDGECCIRARTVVNAAGPWVDDVRRAEDSDAGTRLALSKGIHIVFPREALPVTHTVIINTPDKRAIFAVPRGAFTYIGTTDTFYSSTDYWPQVERSDVDYLIDATKTALHAETLSKGDSVSVWAGIRPLIRRDGKSASDISRKDEIWTGPEDMLSIAGGKLSAYRAMAERIVDKIIVSHGLSAKPCTTAETPLPGGEAAARSSMALNNLGAVASERLLRLYGTEADDLAADGGDIAAEARRAVLVEGAMRLEDYWVRRSGRAWFDANAGLDSLAPAGHEMAKLLDWSAERQKREVEHCREIDRRSKASITG